MWLVLCPNVLDVALKRPSDFWMWRTRRLARATRLYSRAVPLTATTAGGNNSIAHGAAASPHMTAGLNHLSDSLSQQHITPHKLTESHLSAFATPMQNSAPAE